MAHLEKSSQQQGNQEHEELSSWGLSMPSLSDLAIDASKVMAEASKNLPSLGGATESVGNLISLIPGAAQISGMLAATREAGQWLAKTDWKSVLSEGLGLNDVDTSAYEKETSFILNTLSDVEKSLPQLREIMEQMASKNKRLEEIQQNPTEKNLKEALEIDEELMEYKHRAYHHLSRQSSAMGDVRDTHENLILLMRDDKKNEGLSVQEIDKELSPLIKSRVERDRVPAEMQRGLNELREHLGVLGGVCDSLDDSRHEYEECAEQHGGCSKKLVEEFEQERGDLEKHICEYDERLEEISHMLEDGAEMSSVDKELEHLSEEANEYFTEETKKIKDLVERKADDLKARGVDAKTLAEIRARDNMRIDQFYQVTSDIRESFSSLHAMVEQHSHAHEMYVQGHLNLLRANSVAFHGGVGNGILSLGLFDGPYALTALSFMEEHEKLEKEAKKLLHETLVGEPSKAINVYSVRDESRLAGSVETSPSSQKESYEKRTGKTIIGELSASERSTENTSEALQRDKYTFIEPLGPKQEKEVLG